MAKQTDLLIIGGGPAGLSAAINASSEGLDTIVAESSILGGQAGSSSLIENFIGFPEGISGAELTRRAVQQAAKFDTDFIAPFNVTSLTKSGDIWTVNNDYEESIECKAVLFTMGVSYRSLMAKGISRFIGMGGVSYGSPSLSENYRGKTICIVGGANSAGQAAAYLAECEDCKVILLIRAGSIAEKMSTYLINKIAQHPNITIMESTEIMEAKGGEQLDSLTLLSKGEVMDIKADRLFVLIGAKPKTAFIANVVSLDKAGFICTDDNSSACISDYSGLFAAGDVRSGSVKRVAAAVGEGSRSVNDIHKYLGSLKQQPIKVN